MGSCSVSAQIAELAHFVSGCIGPALERSSKYGVLPCLRRRRACTDPGRGLRASSYDSFEAGSGGESPSRRGELRTRSYAPEVTAPPTHQYAFPSGAAPSCAGSRFLAPLARLGMR